MASTDTTTIVIVFVSFGGVFFLAFFAVALCCFIKKMKNKKKKVQETEVVDVDEHLKVKEAITEGPHGAKAVVLSIEDDIHIQEEIRKNEKFGHGLQAKAADIGSVAYGDEVGVGPVGASSSGSTHHHHLHLHHKA